jgi:hypothetical protein
MVIGMRREGGRLEVRFKVMIDDRREREGKGRLLDYSHSKLVETNQLRQN